MHQNPEIQTLLMHMHHPSLKQIMPGLERMHALLKALGNPEKKLPPVIHVAGTNGKGSTCAYLTAILQHAGLTVHRYTSPHLVRFNERIMLANQEIDDSKLGQYLTRIAAFSNSHPTTFFEATTTAAMLAFSEHPADVCILEVGLGGRLDATNVVERPLLSIITPIAMDHMDYLGDTLAQIAYEKAGIMKPHIPCVIAKQQSLALQELRNIAHAQHTPLLVYNNEWHINGQVYISENLSLPMQPSLPGNHQLKNAGVALAATQLLQRLKPEWNLNMNAATAALSDAKWPARLQKIMPPHPYATQLAHPSLWLDGGHNANAAEALSVWLALQQKPRTIIIGMLKDKDAKKFIQHLQDGCERMICIDSFTEQPIHTKDALTRIAESLQIPAQAAENIDEAIQIAASQDSETVLICGSLYLAGNVLSQSGT